MRNDVDAAKTTYAYIAERVITQLQNVQQPWRDGVSGKTVSWGLELLHYPLCLQGSDTEEKGVPVKCNLQHNWQTQTRPVGTGSLDRDERHPIYLGEESGGLATPKCRILEGSP